MDIRLQTGRLDPSLELIACKNMDGGTYGSLLVVRSGELTSNTEFYFSRDSLASTLHSINEMLKGKDESCRLGEGNDYVDFQHLSGGGLVISGHVQTEIAKPPAHELPTTLSIPENSKQQLRFCFVVNDECLVKLLQDLSRLLDDIGF